MLIRIRPTNIGLVRVFILDLIGTRQHLRSYIQGVPMTNSQ